MEPYETEKWEIISGTYTKFRAKESQMKPGNYAVYGLTASSKRWRAVSSCEPDQAGAERLARRLNKAFCNKTM